VITIAATKPPLGIPLLISILRGFVANCFVFDFDDCRCWQDIRTRLDALPDDFNRKLAKMLFAALFKNNRFVCVIEGDYPPTVRDLEQALRQAVALKIQMFLTEEVPTEPLPDGVELAGLSNYYASRFERSRNESATLGRIFVGGEMDTASFLESNFGNMV